MPVPVFFEFYEMRRRAGVSSKEAAARLGISPVHLFNLEEFARVPSLELCTNLFSYMVELVPAVEATLTEDDFPVRCTLEILRTEKTRGETLLHEIEKQSSREEDLRIVLNKMRKEKFRGFTPYLWGRCSRDETLMMEVLVPLGGDYQTSLLEKNQKYEGFHQVLFEYDSEMDVYKVLRPVKKEAAFWTTAIWRRFWGGGGTRRRAGRRKTPITFHEIAGPGVLGAIKIEDKSVNFPRDVLFPGDKNSFFYLLMYAALERSEQIYQIDRWSQKYVLNYRNLSRKSGLLEGSFLREAWPGSGGDEDEPEPATC